MRLGTGCRNSRRANFTALIEGEKEDLTYAPQSTYWHRLDLIPALSVLFDAEFIIPSRVIKTSRFQFWDILNKGIKPLTESYDVIVIDMPPALSYLTINALIASDGVLMPCPPDAFDFASSTQFWHLFSDIAEKLPGVLESKRFDSINIVLTKVKIGSISQVVRGWLQKAYPHNYQQSMTYQRRRVALKHTGAIRNHWID